MRRVKVAKKFESASARHGVVFRRIFVDDGHSVGSVLTNGRSAIGRTLADCSRRLGIPERYLRALEAEDLDGLPGLVYEKHFIQRYARLLQLSPAPMVSAWMELRLATPSAQFVPRVRWWDLLSGPLVWRRFIAALVVLVLAGYLGGRLVDMAAPPDLALTTPSAGQIVTTANMSVKGNVTGSSTLTVNGQVTVAAPDGTFSVPVTLEPGPNTIRVVAEKRFGRAAIVERQVFMAAGEPIAPLRTSAVGAPQPR